MVFRLNHDEPETTSVPSQAEELFFDEGVVLMLPGSGAVLVCISARDRGLLDDMWRQLSILFRTDRVSSHAKFLMTLFVTEQGELDTLLKRKGSSGSYDPARYEDIAYRLAETRRHYELQLVSCVNEALRTVGARQCDISVGYTFHEGEACPVLQTVSVTS